MQRRLPIPAAVGNRTRDHCAASPTPQPGDKARSQQETLYKVHNLFTIQLRSLVTN